MLRATYQFLARRSTLFGFGGLLVLWAFPLVSYGFMSTIQEVLLKFVTVVFGWLVWAGAMLLNYTVNEFVIGFGRFFINSGLGNTVDALWVIVRDIFNLGFIFGLVYIGLRMIFDSSDSNAKKLLAMLILAALLVNFSLFFSKTIVDVANYTAAQIASVFPQPDPNSPNVEVAGAFAARMGLNSMFTTNVSFQSVPQGAAFGYIIGTLILYIVAAFVFFSGAFMLLVRFAVLNLYLIFSPLMFAGWVFPGAAKVTNDYWSGFLGRAFFAPAYLLMLYFSYRILDAFAIQGGSLGELFGDSTVAAATFASVVPPFALTCIFLIASLVVAQKMGAQGAAGSLAIGKSITGTAKQYTKRVASRATGAATFGVAAKAGQISLGQGANYLAENKSVQKWLAERGTAGRYAMTAVRGVADSSFDARNVGGWGGKTGFGGSKGGFVTAQKAMAERDKKFRDSLGTIDTRDENGNYLMVTNKEGKQESIIAESYKKIYAEQLADKNSILSLANQELNARSLEVADAETAAAGFEAAQKAKNAELSQLYEELKAAGSNADKQEVQNRIDTAEGEKAGIKTNLEQVTGRIKQATRAKEKALDKVKDIEKQIELEAEAAVKYANRLAFMDAREREANRWQGETSALLSGLGGGSAGIYGASAAGLVGAASVATASGAGAAGVLLASAYGSQTQASVKAMRKDMGRYGYKKMKAENKKKALQEKLEAENELLGDDERKKPKAETGEGDTK